MIAIGPLAGERAHMAENQQMLLLAEIADGTVPAAIRREHLTRSHNVAIRIPAEDAATFEDIESWLPPATLWLHTPDGMVVIWRLAEWQPFVVAERLAQQVAAVFGGEPVLSMPLPFVNPGVAVISQNPNAVHRTRDFRGALNRLIEAAAVEARCDTSSMPQQPEHVRQHSSTSAFRAAADIQAASTRWLWPGVIPQGALTMLAGKPKRGKTQIAVSLAAIVSNGGVWPTGERCTPGGVVLMEAEDSAARTKSRLEAAGGDMGRVSIRSLEDGALNLAAGGMDDVEAEARRMGGVRLVIVSPVHSHFGASGTADDAAVRSRLAPLLGWASQNDVAVIGITHPRKDARILEDYFSGADGFRRAARAAFVAHYAPKDEAGGDNELAFNCVASTDASDDFCMRYVIEGVQLPGGVSTSRVRWLGLSDVPRGDGGQSGFSSTVPPAMPQTETWTAADWLRLALGDGPQPRTDLVAEALGHGWAATTVDDAKRQLGVVGERRGQTAWWRLPGAGATMTAAE
jgi:putative DNA primase/helicase